MPIMVSIHNNLLCFSEVLPQYNNNQSLKKNHFLVTKYKDVKVEQPKKSAPNVVSSNPLDNLDCEYCNLCYYIIVINKLCCFL